MDLFHRKNDKATRPKKYVDIETRIYKILSVGTILSGLLALFASRIIGLSLIFLGSMVFSETNAG